MNVTLTGQAAALVARVARELAVTEEQALAVVLGEATRNLDAGSLFAEDEVGELAAWYTPASVGVRAQRPGPTRAWEVGPESAAEVTRRDDYSL